MAFDSLEFVLFLVAVLGVYAALPGKLRVAFLVGASLAFYAVWSVPLTSLILISGFSDYAIGLALARTDKRGRRRALLAASLVINLGILAYFKYKGFFLDNLVALGLIEDQGWVALVLPPGISFYTFQTMSYSVDVYRRELEPEPNPLNFLLYVAFFPQLIAGPIERAGRLLPQFAAMAKHRLASEDLAAGVRLIIFGLFKKAVLADSCGLYVDAVFAAPETASGWPTIVACLAFTLQIYFDFSAYSEIAKGSARMLGVELIWNFDQPYLATNVSDFWRRWHISLSTWFRDYVYKPLGGSRGTKGRVLFNLAATMFLSGLWHGAAWNFVVWGLFHGLLLLLHHQLRERPLVATIRERWPQLLTSLGWLWTIHAVIVGWLLFRVEAFADLGPLVRGIGDAVAGHEAIRSHELGFIGAFYAFVALSGVARRRRWHARIDANPTLSLVFYGALAVAAIALAREQPSQFIYFQF